MSAAQKEQRVTSLDRARFDKLDAKARQTQAAHEVARAELDAFCRAYSDTHRFKVKLNADQVRRDLEFAGRRG